MASNLVATLERFEHMNCNIGDLDLVLFDTLALHPIVDHDVTEWARSGDALSSGCEQLL